LKRKQKRKGEIEKKKRDRNSSSKTKHSRDTTATNVTVPSLAKKTEGSIAGTDKICSNGRSRENKCGHSISKLTGRIYI